MPLGQRIARIAPNGAGASAICSANSRSAPETDSRRWKRRISVPPPPFAELLSGIDRASGSPRLLSAGRGKRRTCPVHIKRSHRDEDMLAEAISPSDSRQADKELFHEAVPRISALARGWVGNNLIAYYALRIPAIVLAALVPALVALDFGTVGRTITVVLGVIVAAATAVEHFLTSGQRWRHYRGSVELMKSEGWLYLELAGPYANLGSLEAAFPTFVRTSGNADAG